MKTILGLDLGTNSIGWAVLNTNANGQAEKIEMAGSRIIPMDAAILGDFDKGNAVSQTAERTHYRSTRRLYERQHLRRERLLKVLNVLGFLPDHYKKEINFENHHACFLPDAEPKLPWVKDKSGKYKFLFQSSFHEMLADFAKGQPDLVAEGKKIPYDWTIYYLRKKALTEKISKEELAWILLNFNQKRGYYQARGEEEEENTGKLVELHTLKIVKVEATNSKKGDDIWYNVHLENGWIYKRSSRIPLEWEGLTKDFIVTTEINSDGTPKKDKNGEVKRSFRAPQEDDWALLKKRTEANLEKVHKTVGSYIYDTLLQNPKQKIIGKLVRTIERKFYKDELRSILQKQCALHPELQDKELYRKCVEVLYPSNHAQRKNIANRGFSYLLIEDILFYQRPLKSKKSLIDNCPYETREFVDHKTGEIKKIPIKCIAKSHPLFQEFRLWQFLSNLRIYQKEKRDGDKILADVDVTQDFLKTMEDYARLFDWLNDRKEIDQKTFLNYEAFGLKKSWEKYRWNYMEDKKYPCNGTRYEIGNRLAKIHVSLSDFSRGQEIALWHILYSVSDKQELEKALNTFAEKNLMNNDFVEAFKKFPPFKSKYGAYSEKAIKKLLSLMRCGKYWDEGTIATPTKEKITQIIVGKCDPIIQERARKSGIELKEVNSFQRLPLWLACYVVYNRHSETKDIIKWKSPADIDAYLQTFRHHSLHNPIVEQVVTETLRVVRDIWEQVGKIDEIHVELGREMKNPTSKRKEMSERMQNNENANLRIKTLLAEFINPEYGIENVRPYSPAQQEILRIYEDGVLNSGIEIKDDVKDTIKKLSSNKQPTKSEFMRYKLWLEQNYCSPYTGAVIPLGKLFTPMYEIEHVIPQSRYFDDSFSNKVICEAAVNKLKDNQLGFEFIKSHHGEKVDMGLGNPPVTIFTVAAYEQFVREHYSTRESKAKRDKLLMEEIPEKFIQRQLNDSRYISRLITSLLSNVVREEANGVYEQEATSKNVIVCTGGVTDRLKKDWGMNDVWNKIVYPRFERLNVITDSTSFGHWDNKEGKRIFQTEIPLEFQKGFSKKRIDHRHHAMDAIVIACATRNIVNYLNNESAKKDAKISRHDLQRLLCDKHKTDDNGNYQWLIKKPWQTFTQDTERALKETVVSLKQNLRVINKTSNVIQSIDQEGRRNYKKQEKGDNWAIRKPMHKETVFGAVNLRKKKEVRLPVALQTPELIVDKSVKAKVFELLKYKDPKGIERYFKGNATLWKNLNLAKVPVYYFTDDTKEPLVAVRKSLDTSFKEDKIKESVTDTGIRKILLNHLHSKQDNVELAFSPEGIEEMNRNLSQLNDGKQHQPIYKVRIYEPKGNKFCVGETGNKTSKYVEAAKNTNLFFAIYQTEKGQRAFETIPLNIVIERKKQGALPVPEQNENGDNLLFWLSPNDLAYLPTKEERELGRINEPIDKSRIYKVVSFTGKRLYAIPCNIAKSIVDKQEYTSLNKVEFTDIKESIKEICIPIKVNRLGKVIEIKYKP